MHRRVGFEPDAPKRRGGFAGARLAVETHAVACLGDKHHLVERGGIHMPACRKKPLADRNRLGKRARRILERREHEVAERMVAREREAVFERARQRVGGIGRHGREAFADVARRQDARLFAQDAGRAAVVGHGHHGRHVGLKRQKRPDRYGRARAAADDDGLHGRRRIVQRLVAHFAAKARERRRRCGIVGERHVTRNEFGHISGPFPRVRNRRAPSAPIRRAQDRDASR